MTQALNLMDGMQLVWCSSSMFWTGSLQVKNIAN